jgi:hypothetical protein
MNRREVLAKASGVLASCGVTGSVSIAEEEPAPLLAVIRTDKFLDGWQQEAIHHGWNRLREMQPGLPPAVLLPPGHDLSFVRIDPATGKVIEQ